MANPGDARLVLCALLSMHARVKRWLSARSRGVRQHGPVVLMQGRGAASHIEVATLRALSDRSRVATPKHTHAERVPISPFPAALHSCTPSPYLQPSARRRRLLCHLHRCAPLPLASRLPLAARRRSRTGLPPTYAFLATAPSLILIIHPLTLPTLRTQPDTPAH